MSNKRNIHILSPDLGSIGEITNSLIDGLTLTNEFVVTIEGKEEPIEKDILLVHFLNPAITKEKAFDEFKHKILIQPIDGTSIKKDVVDDINKYDLIITPANAGKKIMITNGIKNPIIVIPNFYKEKDLNNTVNQKIKDKLFKQCDLKGKLIFYHESTFHPRKGIEFLYEGFVRAFSDTIYHDKVVLLCKDYEHNELTFEKIEKIKRDTIKLQSQYKNPASIYKISQNLSYEQLQTIWNLIDVYVSFAKIEGFGIPLLRMAVKEKPIITLKSEVSGCLDYLNDNNSYLVDSQLEIADSEFMYLYDEKTQWSIPKIEDVIKGYKKVAQDYFLDPSLKKLKKPSLNDFDLYSEENIMLKYISVIKSII